MSGKNPKTDDKSHKTDESIARVAVSGAAAVTSVAESSSPPPPAIFMLNVDCLHNIFEWMTLNDLKSIAGTCKRLHQAAGDFFRWNYASKEITIRNGSIYTPFQEINIFIEYIPRISITCTSQRLNRLIGEQCKSLRHIRLTGSLLEDRIEHLNGILKHAEIIDIVECPNREEFYQFFLQYAANVKTLSVQRSYKIRDNAIVIGCNNDWMLRTYPTLKHFELTDTYELRHNELRTFFQQNPQIRTFSTDSYGLCENLNAFMGADLHLDRLAIEFTTKSMANDAIDVLNKLYECGIFKRLHVYLSHHSREYLECIFSMPYAANALEMFHGPFNGTQQQIPFPHLNTLNITHIDDYESLLATDISQCLPNLERLFFAEATTDHVLPFIRSAVNLRAIKIKRFGGGSHYIHGYIDLRALNRERERLNDAKKCTIYIHEYFVRAMKWAGIPTKCTLLEFRRYEAKLSFTILLTFKAKRKNHTKSTE